jgi:hypothetical protein
MVILNMATYPLSITTTVSPEWGIVSDYADDGTLHRRELFTAQNFMLNANWDLLDLAKRDAIESLLLTNRLQVFQIDFDGHRYTAEMVTPPARHYPAPQLFGITAAFRGTRAAL